MCHACVMENVKSNMLSRRGLFRGGVAAAAVIAVPQQLPADAPPLFAQAASPVRAEDLTHELHEKFPTFFGEQQVFYDKKFSHEKDGLNLYELRINEHTGTHIDAPLHFSADGKSVAELPVGDLVAPLVVVDIRARAADDADAQLTPDDLKAWTDANGDLPEGAVVALNSGWDAHVGTDKFRNADAEGKMHFPGFHIETIHQLLEGSARAIAVDTLSLDFGPSPDFAVHNTWLPAGRYGIEGIANLAALPANGATIVVGAPKVRGGTGGPARVFAFV